MSTRCEDYPCCGHEPGACPDKHGRVPCVTCGKRLPKGNPSALCDKCLRRLERRIASGDIDHDHSMDY